MSNPAHEGSRISGLSVGVEEWFEGSSKTAGQLSGGSLIGGETKLAVATRGESVAICN